MNKLIFCLGNIAAWFALSVDGRHRRRAAVNMFFYRGQIRRFLRDTFGVRLQSLEFVRQRTLNRAVYLANGKYYIKVFRDVSPQRLGDFAFLVNYVRKHIGVNVPRVFVSSRYQMYACEKISGRPMESMSPAVVRPHADKIRAQVFQIIDELQSIDVDKIPNNTRFETPMQHHHLSEPISSSRVLEHFDLSDSNIFLDKNMDVCGIIDWDTLYISHNPDADRTKFVAFFHNFFR